jgi:hypothetical protein
MTTGASVSAPLQRAVHLVGLDQTIAPAEPLSHLPDIPRGGLVVEGGRWSGVMSWPFTACTALRPELLPLTTPSLEQLSSRHTTPTGTKVR